MKTSRINAGVGALALVLATVAGFGWNRAAPAYSQTPLPTRITNTTGQALPVLDGQTGEPVWIGDEPWIIRPGQQSLSFPWQNGQRFFYGGLYYHYIGSEPDPFRFYLVEDWVLNGGIHIPAPGVEPGPPPSGVDVIPVPTLPSAVPTLPPPPTPTATATPIPSPTPVGGPGFNPRWNYRLFNVNYEPNCGLTMIKGNVVNPDGIGREGVKVRVLAANGNYGAVSNFTNKDGYYDVTLANEPKAGDWIVEVFIEDDVQSNAAYVSTNTEGCGPNGTGRQIVKVDFIRLDMNRP